MKLRYFNFLGHVMWTILPGGRSATSSNRERGGRGSRSSNVTCFRYLLRHQWRHKSWRQWQQNGRSEEVGGQYETEDNEECYNYYNDDDDEYQRRTPQSTTFEVIWPRQSQVCRQRLVPRVRSMISAQEDQNFGRTASFRDTVGTQVIS